MNRDNKPKGFFYLDHRTVDNKANIITNVHVTAGNVHDAVPYLARLERQTQRFGFSVQYVGLDAVYHTTAISKGLEDKGVKAVFGYRQPPHRQGYLRKNEFIYIAEIDQYVCRQCPLISRCTQNAKQQKTVTRHVWEDSRERQVANRLTPWGKAIYQRRKETVERSFQRAASIPLRAVSWSSQSAGAMPDDCRSTKHQENRTTGRIIPLL